jgi:hypothetical protein
MNRSPEVESMHFNDLIVVNHAFYMNATRDIEMVISLKKS